MSKDSPEAIKKSQSTYAAIGGVLLVLTGVTVAVAFISLPVAGAIAVALLIASLKGGLVASIFMHLNHEKKIIYALLGLTAVFFTAVLALPLITQSSQVGENIAPAPIEIHGESYVADHGDDAQAEDHSEGHTEAEAEEAPAH